ncbi:MAG: hypothetical protein U0793_06945 [Gemmataceae bacterium]
MPKRPPPTDDFDSPWKDALQRYLPSFLALLFADIHADIDWTRGYEALDKEFQQIARRAKVGKRLADKLFKVWLKDGAERWLLIHIEIQGGYERAFAQRMFDYNVAVRQLYNQTVVSLAVLCDDQPSWRPTTFAYGHWGCKMELTFRVAKLLEHCREQAVLAASDNPLAAVVLAHCQAIETRNEPARRRDAKLQTVKNLYRRGWSKEEVRQLYRLIDWILTLPEDLDAAYRADLHCFEEETNMPWLTTIERAGYKRGLEEGLEKGLEKGERKGLLEGIVLDLDAKFGRPGRKFLPRIRELALPDLRKLAKFLKTAETLDDVRGFLN